jgi:succinate dehydrogenase / fumarate reductase cytochrome b subunit
VAGLVSILHRVKRRDHVFLLLPFIWMFWTFVSSELPFAKFTSAFQPGLWIFPWLDRQTRALALIWSYLQSTPLRVCATFADGCESAKAVSKEFGMNSAPLYAGCKPAADCKLGRCSAFINQMTLRTDR